MTLLKSIVQAILKWAAQRQLAATTPFVIGVTGSSGKTTTKEAIGHVLKQLLNDREVRVAAGSLNTEFGLPLVILGLPKAEGNLAWIRATLQALLRGLWPMPTKKPVVYVLEYGVQHPGDMKDLVDIVRPDVAVVTNIGTVHFGSPEATAREKVALVRAVPSTGLVILNGDDTLTAAMAERTEAKVLLVHGTPRELSRAIAVEVAVHAFGLPASKATAALKQWSPPTGRLNLLPGSKGSWLLDDSFNANPQSVTLALAELRRLGREKKAKRLVAVLGDMLELGPEENKDHMGIALLGEKVADLVILVGPRMRRTKRGAVWFPGPVQAAEYLKEELRKGDLVLIKGSQGMRMEKVSEVILHSDQDVKKLLVRQTDFWKKKPYVAP